MFAQLATTLFDNGYLPIPLAGKRPTLKNWSKLKIDREQIEYWAGNGQAKANVGILCGVGESSAVYAADFDIYDAEVSRRVMTAFAERFGTGPIRIGQAPKALMVYASKPGQRKLQAVFRSPDGREHKLEILGTGQQFAAFGTHPDTGQRYEWPDERLYEVETWELPRLNFDAVRAWLKDTLPDLLPDGWKMVGRLEGAEQNSDPLANLTPPLDIAAEEIRRVLAALDPDMPHDDWLKVGMGLHHQYGGADEGFQLWDAWSRQGQKYDARVIRDKWRSFDEDGDVRPVTMASVIKMALETGRYVALPKAGEANIPEAQHLTTDLANAHRLRSAYEQDLIVVNNRWYVWVGTHWEPDDAAAYRMSCALSKKILEEANEWAAKKAKSEEEAKRNAGIAETLRKWGKTSEMKSRIDAAYLILKQMLSVETSKLDADPWKLNCINGTVDLRTGKIGPHRKEDYITVCLPTAYDPAATCPTFERAVWQIFGGNQQMISFVQRLFGYSATGSVRDQVLPVHYGHGSNGKSLLLNTVHRVLGRYAATAAPNLLMVSHGERHATEIADLRGKRFVIAHESGEGGTLREDFIKQATGGDRLKGRFMRGDFFEFDPTHKLALITNHKPQVRGRDHGIWRRLLLIPYEQRFGSKEEVASGAAAYLKDESLAEKLMAETEGILAWIVRGAVEWHCDGLRPPEEVKAATSAYREEQNRVGQFIRECCIFDPAGRTQLGGEHGVFKAYQAWCKDNGYHAMGMWKFRETLLQEFARVKIERHWDNKTYVVGLVLDTDGLVSLAKSEVQENDEVPF